MAVRLRLRREGTKKKPHFRIVAADHRSPRDGRFIEIIGDYHPMANPSVVNIDEERALHWLKVGATPSNQVENLLRITGVWEKFRPGDTAKPEHTEAAKPSKKAKARADEATATEASPPSDTDASEPEVTAPATDADEQGGVEDTVSDPQPEAAEDTDADATGASETEESE